MSNNLTGSALDKAEICSASCALPTVYLTDNRRTKKGTITHRFIELGLLHGRDHAMQWIDEQLKTDPTLPEWVWVSCSNLPLEDLTAGYDTVCSEAGFILDVQNISCAFIGSGQDRNYGKHEVYQVPATADLVLTDSTGTLMPRVIEFKTYDAGSADDHLQLAFLCAAAGLHHNAEEVEGCLVHIPPDGTPHWKSAVFDTHQMTATMQRVNRIAQRVTKSREIIRAGGTPDLKRGNHCKFCGVLPVCPAYTTLASKLAGDPSGGMKEVLGAMTPERVGAAYDLLTQIEGFCEVNRELIRNLVAAAPAVMPDGRTLALQEYRFEEIKSDEAYPILADMVGDDLAAQCLDYTLPKAKMFKVLGEKEAARVMVSLRGAYAVRNGLRPRLTISKPPKEKKVKIPKQSKLFSEE